MRSQEDFNTANSEQLNQNPENAVDARANNSPEAQKARQELEQFFAQKAEQKATEIQETKTRIEPSEELSEIPVERDADKMPSVYYKKTIEMIKKDENDPHELCDDLAEARWDFMRKIFGRDLGDGLNGEGKKAA